MHPRMLCASPLVRFRRAGLPIRRVALACLLAGSVAAIACEREVRLASSERHGSGGAAHGTGGVYVPDFSYGGFAWDIARCRGGGDVPPSSGMSSHVVTGGAGPVGAAGEAAEAVAASAGVTAGRTPRRRKQRTSRSVSTNTATATFRSSTSDAETSVASWARRDALPRSITGVVVSQAVGSAFRSCPSARARCRRESRSVAASGSPRTDAPLWCRWEILLLSTR